MQASRYSPTVESAVIACRGGADQLELCRSCPGDCLLCSIFWRQCALWSKLQNELQEMDKERPIRKGRSRGPKAHSVHLSYRRNSNSSFPLFLTWTINQKQWFPLTRPKPSKNHDYPSINHQIPRASPRSPPPRFPCSPPAPTCWLLGFIYN